MMECKDIVTQYLQYLQDGFECHHEGPYLVLETPHLYSDGDVIELFVQTVGDRIKISDAGETARKLELEKFNWKSTRARSLFAHILTSTSVGSNRGDLYIVIDKKESLGERIADLIQAIQQTDYLRFTTSDSGSLEFRDDVEVFLRKEGFEPELNYEIIGHSGTHWRTHFFINHNKNVMIKALSATSKGGAKYQVSATHTAFSDIKLGHPAVTRSIIVDDEDPDVWDTELLNLAEQVVDIEIGRWTNRSRFAQVLQKI